MKTRVAIAITCPDPFNRKATLQQLGKELGADFVYEVTLVAPDKTLAENENTDSLRHAKYEVQKLLDIISRHPELDFTNKVAVAGHTDCAGDKEADISKHYQQILAATQVVGGWNLTFSKNHPRPVIIFGVLEHKDKGNVDLVSVVTPASTTQAPIASLAAAVPASAKPGQP